MKKSLNKDILKKKKLYKLKVIFEKGVDLANYFFIHINCRHLRKYSFLLLYIEIPAI